MTKIHPILTLEIIKKLLISSGYTRVKEKSSTRVAVITEKDRIESLKNISTIFQDYNAKYNKSFPGSSVGAVEIGPYVIFVKPNMLVLFGSKSTVQSGFGNELHLVDTIKRYLKVIGPTTDVVFRTTKTKKQYTLKNIKGAKHSGIEGNRAKGVKADVIFIGENGTEYPISLKKDNAEYWQSADKWSGDAKKWIGKLLAQGKIECGPKPKTKGKDFLLKPNFAWPGGKQDSETVIFGSDILGNGAVITKSFSSENIYYDGLEDRIIIDCSSIIRNIEDVPDQYRVWFLVRQQAGRNHSELYPGLRVFAVYEKRIGNTILRAA